MDPDAVARALNPMNPAAAAIAAGREVQKTIDSYLGAGVSFAVETTLSGKGNLDLIDTAKARGYEIHLVFVGVYSRAIHFPRAQPSGAGRPLHSGCRCEATIRAGDGKQPPSVSVGGHCHFLRQLRRPSPPHFDRKRRYGGVANRSPAGLGQTLSPGRPVPHPLQ